MTGWIATAKRSGIPDRTIVRSEGLTAVIATHDAALIDLADRVVELRDGRTVEGAP